MKLLLDEMWPPSLVNQLSRRGIEAAAVAGNSPLRGSTDAALLTFALDEGYVVVTDNLADFRSLIQAAAAQRRTHASVVFTPNNAFPRGNPRTVGRLVTALDALLTSGIDLTDEEYWLS